jgi:hypothetical protein
LISRAGLGKQATLSSVLQGLRGSWSPLRPVELRSRPGRAASRLAGPDPSVHGQGSAALPGVANDGGVAQVEDLLDDIELAEPVQALR